MYYKAARKIACILLLIITLTLSAIPASAESKDEIKPDFKRIESYAAEQMERYRIPGMALGVIYPEGQVYLKGFGKAGQSGQEVTPKTPFIIGSLSKSFTALAVMQLVEGERIELDKPVRDYIPWFKLSDEETSHRITIRQLLNHTSGIALDAEWQVASTRGSDSLEELVRKMADMKMANPPGEKYEYGNANYIILGKVIEEVSRMPYGEYIRKNIFEPLEMGHSHVSYEEAKKDGMADGYLNIFGFPRVSNVPYREDFLPAYYIISCAEDMTRYISAMMKGGRYKESRILSAEGIEQMTGPQVKISSWGAYGMGWFVGSDNVFHGGSTIDFQAKVNMFMEDGIGTVMLYNTSDMTPAAFFNAGYRDRVEGDVLSIIYGHESDVGRMGNAMGASTISIIFILIGIIIAGLVTLSIIRMFSFGKKKPIWHVILGALAFNLLLPCILLAGAPLLARCSWPVILYHFRDAGYLILVVAGILIIEGLIKVLLVIKRRKKAV